MITTVDVPEITDLIVDYDPETLERRRPAKKEVADRFRALGRNRAASLVEALPDVDGALDSEAIDALFVRIHTELQRLHEEFRHPERALEVLSALVSAVSSTHPAMRMVDVGCGTGFFVRWLSRHAALDRGVELIGCDYNAALIHAARRAADVEQLSCRFIVGNAFALKQPGHIFTSMGVVHHFRSDDLGRFFREQAQCEQTQALMHYDIAPTWLTPIGAWIFHIARMREPIAIHDGVLSALRAHSDDTLLVAAREPLADFSVGLFAPARGPFPLLRVIRPIVALRPHLREAFIDKLGARASLMEWHW